MYQRDSEFKFFEFHAKYKLKDIDYNIKCSNKSEFEKNLLESLKIENEEAELPIITYEPIVHSMEEVKRLNECQSVGGTLDDVFYYVMNGKFPNKGHSLKQLEINILKEGSSDLSQKLFKTQTELIQEKDSKTELALQLFEIQTKLTEKGVI